MTQFGELSLWIALLMAAWCATLAAQGALLKRASLTQSGARGLCVSCIFAALAAAGLMTAFVGGDYSVRYVATHSGADVETLYKVCAFWSGSAGVLLLASLMAAAAGTTAAMNAMRQDADRARAAWTVAILGLIVGAMLALTVFRGNPFALLPRVAGDGRGLDPIFRNPAMAVQPPLLLLGLVGAAVPVALVIAGLVRRDFDGAFVARVRAWALVSWALLTIAFLLGAHWSYTSPGLRARVQGTPAVVCGGAAWIAMTLLLIGMELRRARRSTPPSIDVTRRRAGAAVAACGALLCATALATRPMAKNYDAQIDDGGQYHAIDVWGHQWTFTSQGESRLERQGDDVTQLALLPTRDGVRQPFISSESRAYFGPGGVDIYPAQTVPGIHGTIAQDLFVVLADAGDGHAVLRISFRPFVELGWAGGVLFALGGVLFFWPARAEYAT